MTAARDAQPLGSDLLGGEPDAPAPPGVTFWVEGVPVAKGRARITTRGGSPRAYTPARTRDYEARVREAAVAAMAGAPPFSGPLAARIDASWPALQSGPKALRSAAPTSRPDADNVAKAILDALNGVVYRDDAQVVRLTVNKHRVIGACEPGVSVTVEQVRA